MTTGQQRLGTFTMFIGSFLYSYFLINLHPIPKNAPFEVMLSFSLIIAGGILSYGFKEVDDRLLKAFGVNLYFIGLAYQCRGISSPISCAFCVIGCFLTTKGILFVYLKGGRPTKPTIIFQFCLCLLFFVNASTEILEFLRNNWAKKGNWMPPESIELMSVCLPLGTFHLLLGMVLNDIIKRNRRGRVYLDVTFLSNHSIFEQIYFGS
ncbi:unnamed protein product [Larinioides sclopetarius]|uniref:Uncharacterized protein n=1 Tax=Larinioides sclopetarius TaxID=280406 RepID=A0AAV2BWL7_9ARAC